MFSITPGLKHPGNKIDKDELVVYNLGHLSYAIADLMADDKSFFLSAAQRFSMSNFYSNTRGTSIERKSILQRIYYIYSVKCQNK